MSYIDLSDNVKDSELFKLRGKVYSLKYPVMSELEHLQRLTTESESKDEEVAKRANEDLEAFMYGLITPVDHDANFREEIRNENVKVVQNFNKMMKTVLSLD